MPFTINIIWIIFFSTFNGFMQLAYGVDNISLGYVETAEDDWPDIYYIFFGVAIAAVVLFVMTVMKEPDELN
jgi:hypothetical protein